MTEAADHQFAGVIITIGIVLGTISAPRRRSPPRTQVTTSTKAPASTDYMSENVQYIAGISILGLALFMSSCLGIIQEATYEQYGKKWREGLFYTVSSRTSQH